MRIRSTGLDSRPEHIRSTVGDSRRRLNGKAHRPAVPAPCRPRCPDRGCRRHGQGPHRRRQGQPFRPVRSRCRGHPPLTPCSQSPLCRVSTRCSGANPNPRFCRPYASSASASSRSVRSARASSPTPSTAPPPSVRATCAPACPGSANRLGPPARPWSRCSKRSPPATAPHRHRSRWPGS
jgi:hypothetical protein